MLEVRASDAKKSFSALVRRAERGERITITRYGRPIAILAPFDQWRREDVRQTIEKIREFRKGRTLGGLKIKDLIEAGRRY